MNNRFYPDVNPSMMLPLRSMFDQMMGDPLWLDRPDCPYDDDFKSQLKGLWGAFRAPVGPVVREREREREHEAVSLGEDKWDDLSRELTQLFNDLRGFSVSTGENVDAKEQMAYFRTATSLLDKIVGLGERINNVKAVSQFTAKVISIFDEVLTPEQRTRALEKLGK